MSVRDYLIFICNTKLSDSDDMAELWEIFLLLAALEKIELKCCGFKGIMNSSEEKHSTLQAFNRIFVDHRLAFLRFVKSYVRDSMVAEDIVMEVMLSCWEERDNILWESSPLPYILTCLKNRCLNYLNHIRLSQEVLSHLQEHACWELSNRIATLEACNPDELFGVEVQRIVDETLMKLPLKTRQIFILNRYEGKSYDEIALLLGMSTKNVEYHISKALKELRHALKDYRVLLPFLLCGMQDWF